VVTQTPRYPTLGARPRDLGLNPPKYSGDGVLRIEKPGKEKGAIRRHLSPGTTGKTYSLLNYR